MSTYRSYQQIIRLSSSSSDAGFLNMVSSGKISKACSESKTGPVVTSTSVSNAQGDLVKEKKKITRTKTGCFCCRRRKKKCDEKKPSCSGCVRNNLECVYPTDEDKSSMKKPHRRGRKVSQPSSPELVACSPCTPQSHSDYESPIHSPVLEPFQYTLITPHTPSAKIPYFKLNNNLNNHQLGVGKEISCVESNHRTQISVKSLLN